MATRIIEYNVTEGLDKMQVIPHEIVIQTPIVAGATQLQSSAFGSTTNAIAIDSDEPAHVARGADPKATTSHLKVKAASYDFFRVNPGEKVSILLGT